MENKRPLDDPALDQLLGELRDISSAAPGGAAPGPDRSDTAFLSRLKAVPAQYPRSGQVAGRPPPPLFGRPKIVTSGLAAALLAGLGLGLVGAQAETPGFDLSESLFEDTADVDWLGAAEDR